MQLRQFAQRASPAASRVLLTSASVLLVGFLLLLGLLAHAAVAQLPHLAGRLPSAVLPLRSQAALPAALTGGALTIYIVDTQGDADALWTTSLLGACAPSLLSSCGSDHLIITSADIASSPAWLPRKYGQQLTVLDLRATATPFSTPNAATLPLYVLVRSTAVLETLTQSGLQQELGMGVLLADTPDAAATQVLTIAAVNATRLAAGEDPIVVIDLR